jgi:uncharacterized protein (TIGR03000 family)
MVNKRLLPAAFLELASLLMAARPAQAQSYFYGYYYPDEHRFNSWQLNTGVSSYSTITPMWNAQHDTRSGYTYPIVPTNTPLPSTPSYLPATPKSEISTIRVMVPDSQAIMWFGENQTKSTGTERVYQTPAMNPGRYEYQVKVTYTQAGQKMVQERTVNLTSGQSVVVDFNATVPPFSLGKQTP